MAERLLITGFGSFRDIGENPSAWLAGQLGGQVLEVSFAAVDEFVAELDGESFDTWLMMGVHGAAERMHLECVAKNSCGAGADVRGVIAGPGCIDPGLPPQLHGTLFGDGDGITVDAGGYLCNYLFFKGLARFREKRIGFLHVPRVEVMGLEDQLGEVRRILAGIGE